MIARSLAPPTALYRGHNPRWASQPVSGAGAAQKGGRFNRPGLDAVYLSLDRATALAEYQQTSPFLPPCTLVEYRARARVVDVAAYNPNDPSWDPLWASWAIDWRQAAFTQHVQPPTWLLGDMALADGYDGIVFPSTLPRCGENVVLFPTALFTSGGSLNFLDPNALLPRNQSSWP